MNGGESSRTLAWWVRPHHVIKFPMKTSNINNIWRRLHRLLRTHAPRVCVAITHITVVDKIGGKEVVRFFYGETGYFMNSIGGVVMFVSDDPSKPPLKVTRCLLVDFHSPEIGLFSDIDSDILFSTSIHDLRYLLRHDLRTFAHAYYDAWKAKKTCPTETLQKRPAKSSSRDSKAT